MTRGERMGRSGGKTERRVRKREEGLGRKRLPLPYLLGFPRYGHYSFPGPSIYEENSRLLPDKYRLPLPT